MFHYEVIIVFVVLVFILISLYKEIVGPAFTFLLAVTVLGVTGILTPAEILSGFANEQIMVIIMLLMIGDIIRRTGVLEGLFDRVFSNSQSYKNFMSRMMFLVAGFSAFLNNTPLVALLMPYVNNWSKKNNIAPSKLLMPLSFAAILGGCATLIGTSTNLIVNGLLIDQTIIEHEPLHIFDFVYVGFPMIIIGIIFMLTIGVKLLPNKLKNTEVLEKQSPDYLVEAEVRLNSKLVGKTLEEAGLRNLKGLFLAKIIKKSIAISAVSPETILEEGDRLIFAGKTDTIAELIDSNPGLTFPQVGMLYKKSHTEVVELVVSHNSSLIGKTVKEANFRGKYDAAIVAIHRNGEKVNEKIGEITLKAGDALLILAGGDFVKRAYDTTDFYLLSKVREIRKLKWYKVAVLIGGTILSVLLASTGIISLFMALVIVLITVIMLKIVSPKDLPKSIDFELGIIIAFSLSLGTAMIKTGVAELIAQLFIDIFLPFGKYFLLLGIYIITSILAAYITNKAAVAIIFPIALTMAKDLALPVMPFILVVAFAAAANFMTPIGYQTNLMVYGPGGYSFKDFLKVGVPLTVIYMIVTVLILSFMYF